MLPSSIHHFYYTYNTSNLQVPPLYSEIIGLYILVFGHFSLKCVDLNGVQLVVHVIKFLSLSVYKNNVTEWPARAILVNQTLAAVNVSWRSTYFISYLLALRIDYKSSGKTRTVAMMSHFKLPAFRILLKFLKSIYFSYN